MGRFLPQKTEYGDPSKIPILYSSFLFGVIPPKGNDSLITPSFPALVSCSGENAERYPFFDMLSKMGLKNR